jgi:NodT family efflux transporter outer membrane factor (OMF) lipoprotein
MQYKQQLNLLALLSGFLFLSSCALKDAPTSDSILDTTNTVKSTAQDKWASTVKAGKVDDGWLQNFEDPRLVSIVGEVMANNKSLQAASAQVDAAASLATQAGAALKPSIGLGAAASAGDSSGISSFDSSNAFLNMSWELDVWGRVRSQEASATAAYKATEADYIFARQSLVAVTSKTWFLATQVHGQKQLAEEAVSIFSKLIKIVEARKRAGKAQPQDLPLAKADLANAKAALHQITSSYKEVLRSIEVLSGRYPSGKLQPNAEFIAKLPDIPVGLPSEILERRPDLVAAEQRVAAAFYGKEQAKAARLPKVSLTASAGNVNSGLADMLNANDPIGQAGVSLFAPLYSGGALKAGVEIADANKKAVMSAYAQKVLEAFKEVETALENEKLFLDREENLKTVVDERMEAVRIMKTQYKVGRIEFYNLLQAQAGLLSSRSTLISMRNERLAQRVNLHLALGGSFEINKKK